jgi:cell fate regulator YaaT (PSP1 superfamily)
MGCGSCGTGKVGGCKSGGGCDTGGCNRLNVHDWLANLPFSDPESSCKVIEVSFKNGSRKDFYRNTTLQYFEKGDFVTVEGIGGFDMGEVSATGEIVRLQMKKKGVNEFAPDMKKILRKSLDRDIQNYTISKSREASVQARSREFARDLKLQMKLSEVEIQADGKKATFFYTADDRVDFRELIKQLASEFKLKVEMRQIGIRQEAAKVGGIGSCGRELCCSTWLSDFKSVNTTAARYQNLSINQTKLSGQCGRLKCCLNYELDTYLDALQSFPDNADSFETAKGTAILIKKDIFKNLMWYMIQGGSKHYPLTIQRVKEIKRLNAQGIKPEELEPVDVTTGKPKEIEPQFVDVVGQISLKSLERNDKRRKEQQRENDNRDRNNERRQQDDKNNQPPVSSRGQQRPTQPGQQQQRTPQQGQQQQKAPRSPQQGQQRTPQQGQGQQKPTQQGQGGQQQQKAPQQGQRRSPQQGQQRRQGQQQRNPKNRPPVNPPETGPKE